MQVLQEEQRQKAAVVDMVYWLQRELNQREQLRQELQEEQENGQVSLTRQLAEGRAVMGARTGHLRQGEARSTAGTGSTEPGRLQR